LERDKAHYQDTVKQKDQEISFLQAHIAQLTQSISQLALQPSQEEVKAKELVAVLEMTSTPQSPQDRILWVLANSDGKLERSQLRQKMAMKYVDLDVCRSRSYP
jgi:hypothetical protein